VWVCGNIFCNESKLKLMKKRLHRIKMHCMTIGRKKTLHENGQKEK
jgi:hypothetical protein